MLSEKVEEILQLRGILGVCQDIHETSTGSYDRGVYSEENIDDVYALGHIIENWETSIHSEKYDNAVKNIINIVLEEYYDRIRKDSVGMFK